MATSPAEPRRGPSALPWTIGTCVLLAIAAFFLWEEHRAHLLGALTYALLLACPLMHFFMHRGHGHGVSHSDSGPTSHDHEGQS